MDSRLCAKGSEGCNYWCRVNSSWPGLQCDRSFVIFKINVCIYIIVFLFIQIYISHRSTTLPQVDLDLEGGIREKEWILNREFVMGHHRYVRRDGGAEAATRLTLGCHAVA